MRGAERSSRRHLDGTGSSVDGRIRNWLCSRPLLVSLALCAAIRVVAVVAWSLGSREFIIGDEATFWFLLRGSSTGDKSSWYPYLDTLNHDSRSYTYPATWLMKLFGASPEVPRLLSAAYACAFVGIVVVLVRRIAGRRAALACGVTLALWPSSVLWSSTILREGPSWTGWALVVLGLDTSRTAQRARGRLGSLGLIGAGVMLLDGVRGQSAAGACLVAALVILLVHAPKGLVDRAPEVFTLAVLLPVAIGSGPVAIGEFQRLSGLGEMRTIRAEFAASALVDRSTKTTSPPAATPSLDPHVPTTTPDALTTTPDASTAVRPTTQSNLRWLPKGLMAMFIRPLPWERTTSDDMRLAKFQTIVGDALLLLALVATWRNRQRWRALAPLVVGTGAIATMYALGEGNLGTAFRHRDEFMWMVVALASLLAERRPSSGVATTSAARTMD